VGPAATKGWGKERAIGEEEREREIGREGERKRGRGRDGEKKRWREEEGERGRVREEGRRGRGRKLPFVKHT
jgi:hypothetical protein